MTAGSHVVRPLVAASLCGACIWAFAVTGLWVFQSDLVFMTGLSRQDMAPVDPRVFSEHHIISGDDIQLSAVARTHPNDHDRFWILFCPPAGASTRVQRIQHHLQELWSLGYNVLAFDYRGFGDSEGLPSEEGLYADATAAYQFLTRTRRVSASKIILSGRSLGSAVAVDVATKLPAAGLLLFSPIDSIPAAAARLYPWAPARWLAEYQFDSLRKARLISIPVVMIHGSGDRYLPLSDARSMLEEFRGPAMMVRTAGGHHHSGFVTIADLNRGLQQYWPSSDRAIRTK